MDIAFSSGNVTGANYRAVYDFEYTKDSINSIKGEDILYLEISKIALLFQLLYLLYRFPDKYA